VTQVPSKEFVRTKSQEITIASAMQQPGVSAKPVKRQKTYKSSRITCSFGRHDHKAGVSADPSKDHAFTNPADNIILRDMITALVRVEPVKRFGTKYLPRLVTSVMKHGWYVEKVAVKKLCCSKT
jgi:hypothetical protein